MDSRILGRTRERRWSVAARLSKPVQTGTLSRKRALASGTGTYWSEG